MKNLGNQIINYFQNQVWSQLPDQSKTFLWIRIEFPAYNPAQNLIAEEIERITNDKKNKN